MSREHELAKLAWGKIQTLGHEPIAAITEACIAAVAAARGEVRGLPAGYDRLTPESREVILALWGVPHRRCEDIARELGIGCRTLNCRLLNLWRQGWIARVGNGHTQRGVYRLVDTETRQRRPDVRETAQAGARETTAAIIEAVIAAGGTITPRRLAAAQGCTRTAAYRRLLRLVAVGRLIHYPGGVYALAANAARSA